MNSTSNQKAVEQEVQLPGSYVHAALDERGISQKDLSAMIGKSAPVINDIIKGKRSINAEIAVLLEAVTEIKAKEWLDLQSQYDIQKAYQNEALSERCQKIRDWAKMKAVVNISVLKKKLGIKGESEDVDRLLAYAGVRTVGEFLAAPTRKMARFRKSEKLMTDPQNLFTWTLIAKHESENIKLESKYSKENINILVEKLNNIFYHNYSGIEEEVKNLLNQYGIKYLHLQKLDKMPVDGISFWIGENPTIVTTRRYDRIDNFAFVIMHELGHITKHLNKDDINEYIESDHNEENVFEQEADAFAEKALWRGAPIGKHFDSWRNPFTVTPLLVSLSSQFHINVGILAGQYRKRTGNYTVCGNLIDKINI